MVGDDGRPAGAGAGRGSRQPGWHRIKTRGRAVPVCSSFVKAYRSSHCIVPSRTSYVRCCVSARVH